VLRHGAWGLAASAAWLAIEGWVEMAKGDPERGALAPGQLLILVLVLGVMAGVVRGSADRLQGRLPGVGRLGGPALSSWWSVCAWIATLVVLRGFRFLQGRHGVGIAWLGALPGALLLALAAAIPVLFCVALARRRGEQAARSVLVAWTWIVFLTSAVVLKLEFHFGWGDSNAPTKAVEALVAGGGLLAAVAAIAIAPRLRKTLALRTLPSPFAACVLCAMGLVLTHSAQLGSARERFLAPPPKPSVSAAPGPSLLLIVIDTLRADRLPSYGYPHPTAPAITQLARHAIQLDHAVSTAPWTLASIGSILTGRSVGAHGAGINPGPVNSRTPLPEQIPILAEIVRAEGLATVGLASNPFLCPPFGLARGFDAYASPLGEQRTRLAIELLTPLIGIEVPSYTTADRMTERALAWLGAHAERRFFMMVHYMDPHTPHLSPPAPFSAPAPLASCDEVPDPALYDGEILRVDAAIARLLEGLRELGLYHDLVIALTSDHGEVLGDRGRCDWDPWFWERPFDHGQQLYDELIRVPLLLKPAGARHAGTRVAETFPMIDLAPTLLELIGLDSTPLAAEGTSWASALRSDGARDLPSRVAFTESTLYGEEAQSISEGRYKLIRHTDPSGAVLLELYDRAADPGERHNIVDREARVADRLETTLDRWLAQRGPAPEAAQGGGGVPAELRDNLRALGYVDSVRLEQNQPVRIVVPLELDVLVVPGAVEGR